MDIKQVILDEISDLVHNFIYYDRKEDEDLPPWVIENGALSLRVLVRLLPVRSGKQGY